MSRCRIHFDPRNPENSYCLPTMEDADRERAEAAALAQGEELTRILRSPLEDVSKRAGQIERESPLFFGQGDNPTLF